MGRQQLMEGRDSQAIRPDRARRAVTIEQALPARG